MNVEEKYKYSDLIFDAIKQITGLTRKDVCSRKRTMEYVNVRRVFVVMMVEAGATQLHASTIISRNRATGCYYYSTHEALMRTDFRYNKLYKSVCDMLAQMNVPK